MSLQITHWYTVDTDGMTIVACGTVQAAHVDTIQIAPGQTLRVGTPAHPLQHYEQNGRLLPYAPVQQAAMVIPPGRGFVWRASKMGWEDRRPIDWARADKTAALLAEHQTRKMKPVTNAGMTFVVNQESLHKASFAAISIPPALGVNDMRWRDVNGVVQTWPTPAQYIAFMKAWAAAVSAQWSGADKWKDDLLDKINAAQVNSDIDAITW